MRSPHYLHYLVPLNKRITQSSSLRILFIFISMWLNLKTDRKWMSLYKWPLYDHSWPFFCHMCVYLSQNWGSDGHFEVLNRSYLWLVQKLWHKMQLFPFLFLCDFVKKIKSVFGDFGFFCVFHVFFIFVITFAPIKI